MAQVSSSSTTTIENNGFSELMIRLLTEYIILQGGETLFEGYSFMHFICEVGDVGVVKSLFELYDPDQLCLVRDEQFRTPLHIAVMEGKEEVVRVLVNACPKSIEELTSLGETALHLALKNDRCGCFQVLLEEIHKLNREELLNRRDNEGNTLLHIATSRKHIQIVNMLLSYKSPNAVPVLHINSTNERGYTALDILHQNPSFRNNFISDNDNILHQPEARAGHLVCRCEEQPSHLPPPKSPKITYGITNKNAHEGASSMTKSVLLAVFIFVAGSAYATLFNLNNIYPLDHHFEVSTLSAKDMIMAPNLLPDIFVFMVFNTATFMGSMVVIMVNTWSLVSKWSFCYRVVPLFVMGAMFVSYALVAKKIIPEFSVTIGCHKISSFWVVWLYDIPLVFSIVTVWLIGKQIICIFKTQQGR